MECPVMNKTLKELLAMLIAFDTTSRESNLAMITAIETYLTSLGIASKRITHPEGHKANLLARIGPEIPGGIMLSGHTDVVPVDGQTWQFPPFALTEQQGRYYGRGTTDMKGFLACVLASLPAFLAQPLRLPLLLAFSYDEEVGCLGVRSLIDSLHAATDKPAWCLVGEPTGMQPVYGHKGKLAMRCQIHGLACHSAYTPDGVNAIEYAATLINRLQQTARQVIRQQNPAYSPPFTTLQVGPIQGGTALNIVPDYCQFDFEIRHLPEQEAQPLVDELINYAQQTLLPEMQRISPQSTIIFQPLSSYPVLHTPLHAPFLTRLQQWCQQSMPHTVAFGTEGGLFAEAGITTLICGPGDMAQGHKPDEYIAISQLNACMSMLDAIRSWLSHPTD
ncbi:MAG: Acetylornithine deacetylase [Candidatus Erwinia impunctatus]|nr:Acetylornithine deacetylase [Culicoides impunctatus]